ncbi:hypothetical protein GCM10010271_70560 [Streptomyces kurssanovii]|nr:hypothetical protein GCM10010271_70560 [Streptomyces kurssanovii]
MAGSDAVNGGDTGRRCMTATLEPIRFVCAHGTATGAGRSWDVINFELVAAASSRSAYGTHSGAPSPGSQKWG